jgi:hypothetical protein
MTLSQREAIDPEIQGIERQAIADIMSTLPEDWRENVILITDNNEIYVNRPELRSVLSSTMLSRDGVLETADGRRMAAFQGAAAPKSPDNLAPLAACSNIGTGGYRRLSSKVGGGLSSLTKYAYSKAIIGLPSESSGGITADLSFETPHVYLGGTGAGVSTEVDAGFMYFKDSTYTSGGWELITNVGGVYTYGVVLSPGSSPTLEFLVPADDYVALRTWGGIVHPISTGPLTIAAYAAGWKTNGVGNTLKRVTSIAQLPGQQDFSTGARLAVDWNFALIGASPTLAHNWSSTDTSSDCFFPTSAVTLGMTDLGVGPDAYNEKVTIEYF